MIKTDELLKKLGPTIKNVKHPYEKLQILIEYIADNLENSEHDINLLNELIFAAKKNISESIIIDKKDKGFEGEILNKKYSNVDLDDANKKISLFLTNPETSIREELSEAFTKEKNKHVDFNKYQNPFILLQEKNDYLNFEKNNKKLLNDKLNFNDYISDTIKEDNPIEKAFNKAKPGFFERMFNRTSTEYKNFLRAYDERMKGNIAREDLDDAARAYLAHKIPSYEGVGLPSKEQLKNLKSPALDRALLCIKALQTSQKSKAYEAKLILLEEQAKINLNPIDKNIENSNEIKQDEFQNELANNFENNNINEIKINVDNEKNEPSIDNQI